MSFFVKSRRMNLLPLIFLGLSSVAQAQIGTGKGQPMHDATARVNAAFKSRLQSMLKKPWERAFVSEDRPRPVPVRQAKVRVAVEKTWTEKIDGKFEEKRLRICDNQATFNVYATEGEDVIIDIRDMARVTCRSTMGAYPVVVQVGGIINLLETDIFEDGNKEHAKGHFSFSRVSFDFASPNFPKDYPSNAPRLPEFGFNISALVDTGAPSKVFQFPSTEHVLCETDEAKPSNSLPFAGVAGAEPSNATADDSCIGDRFANFDTVLMVEDNP